VFCGITAADPPQLFFRKAVAEDLFDSFSFQEEKECPHGSGTDVILLNSESRAKLLTVPIYKLHDSQMKALNNSTTSQPTLVTAMWRDPAGDGRSVRCEYMISELTN